MSILLVEDHHGFAQALAHLIAARGSYEVEITGTGEEALEKLRHGSPDLVMIDVSLPGRSGIWLARALRRLNPSVPVLMISGHDSRPYAEQSLQAGARGYVLKEDVPGIMEGIHAAMNGGTYLSDALK